MLDLGVLITKDVTTYLLDLTYIVKELLLQPLELFTTYSELSRLGIRYDSIF